MADHAPVIRIVKKKAAHGGHHGGSWKVAYADFVTAMMAFFLVMWIISMDQPLRREIQEYFNNPFSAAKSKAGISYLAGGGRSPLASGMAGVIDDPEWSALARQAQQQRFEKTGEALRKQMKSDPDLDDLSEHVSIEVTEQGLLIELLEVRDGLFFASGSAEVPPRSRELLALVAADLKQLPNLVVLEGHTDSLPYRGRAGYSNWELSCDRSNAARRILEASGLRSGQVAGVRGFADTRLRDPSHPNDSTNRRVSILVQYDDSSRGPAWSAEPAPGEGRGERTSLPVQVSPASHGHDPE